MFSGSLYGGLFDCGISTTSISGGQARLSGNIQNAGQKPAPLGICAFISK